MGDVLDPDAESESPRTPRIGRRVTIPSDRYGEIVLRVMTLGDLGFVLKPHLYQLPGREFAVQVIQNQLLSPQLNLESVNSWTDEEILRVVVLWTRQSLPGEEYATVSIASFDGFRDCMRNFRAKETARLHKMTDAYAKQLSDVWRQLYIPRVDFQLPMLRIADQVMTDFKKLNLDSSSLYSRFSIPDIVQPGMLEIARSAGDALSRMTQQNTDIFNTALESINAIQRQIAESLTFKFEVGRLFADLPDITELIRQGEELAKSLEVLRENGFEFTEYLWDTAFVVSMTSIDPRVQAAVMTTRLLSVTRGKEFASELESVLGSSPNLKRRLKVVRPALKAHQSRSYVLSVPCLMAQVEGIFTDALVLKGMAASKNGKLYAKGKDGKIRTNKKGDWIELSGLRAKVDHCDFKNHEVLGLVVDLFLNKIISNRNAVLHGQHVLYGKAKLSTQLALLILVLSKEYAAFEAGKISSLD